MADAEHIGHLDIRALAGFICRHSALAEDHVIRVCHAVSKVHIVRQFKCV